MSEVVMYIDLETTAKGPDNNPGAEYPDNEVVLAGVSVYSSTVRVDAGCQHILNLISRRQQQGYTVRLVAHNLIFDLKWLLRMNKLYKWAIDWDKIVYRCTMVEHYRRTGHRDKYFSLEKLAEYHEVPFKKGLDLGALIRSGVCVSDIDKEELTSYLMADVNVLAKIPDGDYDMQYLLALAEMELNGLPVNTKSATELYNQLVKAGDAAYKEVTTTILDAIEHEDGTPVKASDINVVTPRSMSYYLTGVPEHGLGGKNSKNPIKFKAGHGPVYSPHNVEYIWDGVEPNPNLGYPINAGILSKLKSLDVVKAYKEYKDCNKIINTYIKPFMAEVAVTGSTVHPSLNPAHTNTGRLSSSGPNGQNIPPEVRALVYSTEGRLYDIDFSQLEMVGAATLSDDWQMRKDLCDGMDIHFESGQPVMGWKTPADMTKETRRIVKGVNFGLLYGGGKKGIAENTGADPKIVGELIESFYNRYPMVKAWQTTVYNSVKEGAYNVGVDDKGVSFKGDIWALPAVHGGRRFYFQESLSPTWMKDKYSFKPTETKNYPIQGFAGGDIVMTALAILHHLIAPLGAKFRMTVHDSILIDWQENKEEELEAYMEHVCKVVRDVYNISVPLNFEIQSEIYWV